MKIIESLAAKPRFEYTFLHSLDEILFFDIETTGLSAKASSIYMIGVMFYDSNICSWKIEQYFADDYKSEKQIIDTFLDKLEKYNYLYHFNGRTFDVPYILHKCEKHEIKFTKHALSILKDQTNSYSIDILALIRPLKKKLSLVKANQTALERWLGIDREDQYDGGKLIKVYSEYMQKKLIVPNEAPALEKLLLLHNFEDIENMLNICSILQYRTLLSDNADITITELILDDNCNLIIHFTPGASIPRAVQIIREFPESKTGFTPEHPLSLKLDSTVCSLTIPLLYGTLYHFFSDYKNYYYIPDQDISVHKSAADSIDRSRRKNATAATCYTKSEGFYMPSLSTISLNTNVHTFYLAHRDKICFYPYNQETMTINYNSPKDFWQQYVRLQLLSI